MKIAVLGTRNNSLASAYDWAAAGHDVYLFDFPDNQYVLSAISDAGGVHSVGTMEGFQPVRYAGTGIEKVIPGAELIFVTGQADRLTDYAGACVPYLEDGQIYVVISCGGMGSLAFKNALGLAYDDPRVIVAETHTSPYFSRVIGPGRNSVFYKLPTALKCASLPSSLIDRVCGKLRGVLPGVEAAGSVILTTLQDCGPSTQSVITIMNAPLIERTGGDFFFFRDGITPSVARIIQAVDEERIAIGAALGLRVENGIELGIRQGAMEPGTDYLHGYSDSAEFEPFMAQSSLNDSFYIRDVGYSMVFWIDLARRLGVPVPVMTAIETLASGIMQTNFMAESPRTLKELGIADLTDEQLKNL